MAITYSQLKRPPTEEEAYDEIITLLSSSGFATTAWEAGSVQDTMVRMMATMYSRLAERASLVADQYLNSEAEGDGLTLLARSHYDNERTTAQRTIGNIVLSLNAGEGPYTVAPGEVTVSDGTYNFSNVDAFTLSDATTPVTASFIAEEPGADYNIASFSSLRMQTAYIGATPTNPTSSTGASWITTQGVDEEDDVRLRARNAAKWSSLGQSEVILDRVTYIALSASSEVTQVYVDDTNPRGAGTVDIYLAGDLATIATGTLASVSGTIQSAFFGGTSRIGVYAATEVPLQLTGTIYYSPSYTSAVVEANVDEALDEFVSASPIGGEDFSPGPSNIASLNDIIAVIEGVEGVRKVVINSPTVDISLDVSEKLTKPDGGYFSSLAFVRANR